ncbi:hypothetical protein Lalb_Chr17g0336091 [Lupinus albus]|uniref:Uncharacterized protein n=1 Tax=Lupinus albus TaxID=3870 RepID=A0A6A4P195_LUPAL|nr:hypothetical protein Lalb_Chr17g0336091 [Lupinus albus]
MLFKRPELGLFTEKGGMTCYRLDTKPLKGGLTCFHPYLYWINKSNFLNKKW